MPGRADVTSNSAEHQPAGVKRVQQLGQPIVQQVLELSAAN